MPTGSEMTPGLLDITEILTCEKRLQILASVGWYICTLHRKSPCLLIHNVCCNQHAPKWINVAHTSVNHQTVHSIQPSGICTSRTSSLGHCQLTHDTWKSTWVGDSHATAGQFYWLFYLYLSCRLRVRSLIFPL